MKSIALHGPLAWASMPLLLAAGALGVRQATRVEDPLVVPGPRGVAFAPPALFTRWAEPDGVERTFAIDPQRSHFERSESGGASASSQPVEVSGRVSLDREGRPTRVELELRESPSGETERIVLDAFVPTATRVPHVGCARARGAWMRAGRERALEFELAWMELGSEELRLQGVWESALGVRRGASAWSGAAVDFEGWAMDLKAVEERR